jgi:O-antigen/teichoic acid export membrane protein
MSRVHVMRSDLGSDARSMARGAAVNLGGAIAANVLGFAVTLVTTHLVAPRAVGVVALGSTIAAFALIPSLLGMDTGITRFVARAAATGDERAARASIQAALALVGGTSVVFTALIWWKAPYICEQFFRKPQATDAVRLVGLSLPGLVINRVTMAAVQGLGVMKYSAWLGIWRRLIQLAAFLPLVAVAADDRALALALVASSWGCCLLGVWYLLLVHRRVFVPERRAWPVLALLNFSLPQLLTAIMFTALISTDTFLLGRYVSAGKVGVYSVLGGLLLPATVVSTAVGQMFGPRIAVQEARGDLRTLAAMLKRVTHWNTTVSIPFFAMLIVVPGPLLGLFGHVYRQGATALAILAAGQLLNTAAGPLGQVINMSGRQYLSMSNNALVAGLNVLACLYLIPRHGLAGAATATASSLTFVNLLKLIEVRILFHMHPFQKKSLSTFVAAGIGAAAAAAVDIPLSGRGGPLFEAAVVTAVLFVVYSLVCWAIALTPEDRELVAAGFRRLRRRGRPAELAPAGLAPESS